MLSSLIFSAAGVFPSATRRVLSLSASGQVTHAIFDHWIGHELADRYCADGLLAMVNGELFEVPVKVANFYRHFEPVTTRVIRENLSPDTVFVDVGANIGYFSVVASRVVAKVHAFEPSPSNLSMLSRNLTRHGVQNVIVHPCALSARSGVVTFHLTADQTNNSISPPAETYSKAVGTISVEAQRLDDLQLGKVDFVKMDIQGGEIDALNGMVETVKHNPNIKFLVEWAPACLATAGYNAKDLPDWFRAHGLHNMIAIDDFEEGRWTIEEMSRLLAANPRKYCNILAQR